MAKYFKGQSMWYNLTQGSILIPIFIFLFLRVFDVDFTRIEMWGYIFYIIGMLFILTAGQMYIKQRHQDAVDDVKIFFNGKVRKSKVSAPKMLLGFEALEEVDIKFGSLEEFEKSRRYKVAKQAIIKEIAVEDFHSKRKLKIKDKGKLKKLIGTKRTITEIKEKDIRKALEEQKKEKKKDLEEIERDLPYESLDLKQLDIDVDDLIKNHQFYFGLLYEEEKFDDSLPFERAFIIIRKGKEGQNMLETRRAKAYDKDQYRINISVVDTYCIVIDWVLDTIPILYVKWTENMVAEDVNEVLKVEEIEYLQNRITRHLLNQVISKNKQPELKADRLEAEKEEVEKEYYSLIQDLLRKKILGMGSKDDRIKIDQLSNELRIATRQRYIAYTLAGILIAVAGLLAFITFGLPLIKPI
jgi:hypothetical protein